MRSPSRILLTITITLFFLRQGNGQVVHDDYSISEQGKITIRFDAEMPLLETIILNKETYTRFSYKNTGVLTEPGLPELPVLVRYIPIPENAVTKLVIRETHHQIQVLKDSGPVPRQRPSLRNQQKLDTFYIDSDIYSGTGVYPETHCYIKREFSQGGKRFAELHFVPLLYNSNNHQMELATSLEAEIIIKSQTSRSFEPGFGPMDISGLPGRTGNPLYEGIAIPQKPPTLLIVAHDLFYNSMKPFVRWKTLSGISTKMIRLSEIGSNPDPESIRDFIRLVCQDSGGHILYDHLLLVGDVSFIPSFFGVRNALNDHGYSLIDDQDFLPDLYVGRFSVNSVNECELYVNKTLNYERSPTVYGSTTWFKTGTSIASSSLSDNSQGQDISRYFRAHGFTQVNDLRAANGKFTNTDILSAINNGNSWVFYIGHGDNNGWNTLGAFNVFFLQHYLNNYMNLPVVVSVACSNADLDRPVPSFAEVWMSEYVNKGAVVFIGATEDTPFYLSDTIGKHTLKSFISQNTLTIGEALVYGKLKMNACFPENTYRETEETMEHFLILGDPTLSPWTDVPQFLSVDLPSNQKRGKYNLGIHVSASGSDLPYARVCLSLENGKYWKTTFTDSSGMAHFSMDESDSGYFRVAVSGRNLLPFVDSFLVSNSSETEPYSDFEPTIFPNPAGSLLSVNGIKGLTHYHFEFVDWSGKTVLTGTLTSADNTIDISRFKSGFYMMKLSSGHSSRVVKVLKL